MKPRLIYPIILALSLFIQACAETHATPEVSTETTKANTVVLRVGAPDDDYFFDPKDPGRVTVGMGFVNTNIFENLTRMDSDFQLQPMLAESWEYREENHTWRFYLREDVIFHDGQPFTSKGVVETIHRIALNDSLAGILKIDQNSAVAVDDFTVDIQPTTPNLQLSDQLSHPIFGIRAPGSDPFKGEHIGTGPFKFTEYVQGDHITVEANRDFWGDPPQVDGIEFRFMPEPSARVAALQKGEADLIYSVPLDAARQLSDADNIRVLPSNVGTYQGLSVLLSGESPYEITQDIQVRQAIGYAIDRQAIIDIAFNGFATTSQTLIPASVLGRFTNRVIGYTYDPEQAKALLKGAGWQDKNGDGIREKDGRDLRLELVSGFPNGPTNRQTPEIIQGQLREVGIELTIRAVADTPAYEQQLADKRGDLWLEIGNQNSVSPCFLPAFLYYGNDPNPNIWQQAFAPEIVGWLDFDDEIDRCTATSDLNEAAMHAANAMHILIDQARAAIPLVGLYDTWFTSDDVRGFNPHPNPTMVRWNNVSVTR
jgi:peptide/nickel transport system substrate-binding protein